MTETQEKLLAVFDGADAKGKALIMDMLICASTYGQAFFDAMKKHLDSGDREAMTRELNEWIAQSKKAGAVL